MDMIRVRTNEELEECFGIRKKVFVEEQQVPEELELDEFDMSPDACRHLLIRSNGGIPVGTGRWRPYDHETAKLQRIAVHRHERGTGVGKQIIRELEQWAREDGMTYAMLDGQCQAEAFYRKLGYVTISEEPFEDAGIMHVRMKKRL